MGRKPACHVSSKQVKLGLSLGMHHCYLAIPLEERGLFSVGAREHG